MINPIRSKRGSTLTNWVMMIMAISLFLVLFQSQVLDGMNRTYGKNFSIGLNTDAQTNIETMQTQQQVSSSDLDTAEVSKLSDGITLVQVGSVSLGVWRTIRNFVSGRFLSELLTNNLGLPEQVATVLTILILISLVFVIVRIFMRGVTP